jgi:hypothetical protein
VVNAASLFPGNPLQYPNGAVAPGEIVIALGSGFGTQPHISFNGSPDRAHAAAACCCGHPVAVPLRRVFPQAAESHGEL